MSAIEEPLIATKEYSTHISLYINSLVYINPYYFLVAIYTEFGIENLRNQKKKTISRPFSDRKANTHMRIKTFGNR